MAVSKTLKDQQSLDACYGAWAPAVQSELVDVLQLDEAKRAKVEDATDMRLEQPRIATVPPVMQSGCAPRTSFADAVWGFLVQRVSFWRAATNERNSPLAFSTWIQLCK